MVRVELQLWPQPPGGARPSWWGHNQLSFLDADGKEVWTRNFPEADPSRTGRLAHLEKKDAFGWVLVLEYDHEKARAILEKVGLSEPPGRDER